MRHFDVQLIGGMVLNDGRIAEMKTQHPSFPM
jgi:preprotein translocase subunit SecA